VHDDAGRLVSSRPEPEWDEEQQGWMLALAQCERLTCEGCGGWLPDTTEHMASHYNPDPAPYACGSCLALGAVQRAYAEDYPNDMHATRWAPPEVRADG
jgi:hypothetical protein